MAMLRRMDGPVSCVRMAAPDPVEFAPRSLDWQAQSMRTDSERHVETLRHQRLEREAREEKGARKREEDKVRQALRKAQLEQESILKDTLAQETRRRNGKELHWTWQVDRAASSIPELRSLRSHCLEEQTSAERVLQLLRDEIKDEEARQHEVSALSSAKAITLRAEEDDLRKIAMRRIQGREYLSSVSQQAIDQRAKSQIASDIERQEDRSRIDHIVSRVRDEDMTRFANQKRAQTQLHDMLQQQEQDSNSLHIARVETELKQELHAQEQNNARRSFVDKLFQERQLAEASRQRVLQTVASALERQNLEKRIREELVQQVRDLECQKKQDEMHEERLRKDLLHRMSCALAYKQSLQDLEERRTMVALHEAKERQDLIDKFALDDKLEQLSEQKQRMKRLAHARDIENIMIERRERREQERKKELDELQARLQEEARISAIITEERDRLLQSYALSDDGLKLRQLLLHIRNANH